MQCDLTENGKNCLNGQDAIFTFIVCPKAEIFALGSLYDGEKYVCLFVLCGEQFPVAVCTVSAPLPYRCLHFSRFDPVHDSYSFFKIDSVQTLSIPQNKSAIPPEKPLSTAQKTGPEQTEVPFLASDYFPAVRYCSALLDSVICQRSVSALQNYSAVLRKE